MRLLTISIFWLLALAGQPYAANPDEVLADPVLEARAKEVGLALRCVVCKSQSIEDSDAPLARDLRLLVRERITAGDSESEVLDYVAARYGDYVLLKPPVRPSTWVLWGAPAILLALGGMVGFAFLRQRSLPAEPLAPLSPEEAAALATWSKVATERDT